MQVVRFVLLLLVGIGAANALAWIPMLRWMRRRRDAGIAAIANEVEASGEMTIRGPERGVYRGGTGPHSSVAGNARLLLTDRRLLFIKTSGGRVSVDRASIRSAAMRTSFLGRAVASSPCVVVSMRDGSEIGFVVDDPGAWIAALT